MNFIIKPLLTFLAFFIFVACGGSTSTTGSSTTLGVETTKSRLNSEKNVLNIDFILKKNYGQSVSVELNDLTIDVPSCSIKNVNYSPSTISFDETTNEIAIQALVKFSEPCTPTAYQLKADNLLTLNGETNRASFQSALLAITPDENQTLTSGSSNTASDVNGTSTENNSSENNQSSVDTINYSIQFTLESNIKFNLEEKRSFQVALLDTDSNTAIASQRIQKMTITSQQSNLIKLFDGANNTVPKGSLNYTNENALTLYAQTNTHSGLCDIVVSIEYNNDKGSIQTISKTYALTVLSGPPTSFSINTAGTLYNFETKWYENKFLISATDKYNNLVNISPTIYVSAMTGFVKDSNGSELLHGKFSDIKGSIVADTDINRANFEVNSSLFGNIDYSRDYLIVFGDFHSYEALGKWDIDGDTSSNTLLALKEEYHGENHDSLGFAVGHNYREEICSSDYREWHLKIDSTDGNYKLDEEGKTYVTLKYPPYLYGKRVALSVNFLGQNPETEKVLKSGEVFFRTLHSPLQVKLPDSISVEANTSKVISIPFEMNTGTVDRWWIKNSRVGCETTVKNATLQIISQNETFDDSSKCISDFSEVAYWEVNVTAEETNAGTVTFDECFVYNSSIF